MPGNNTESSKYSFTVTRNFGEFYRRQGVFCHIVDRERCLIHEFPYRCSNFVDFVDFVGATSSSDMFAINISSS